MVTRTPASNSPSVTNLDLKTGIYAGAAVTAVLLLLPYLKLIFVAAFVLGPLAGAWFETRRRSCRLNFTQGAKLGFSSAFYGTIAGIAVNQIAARFLHDQLWRLENIYRLPPLLAGKGLETDTPAGWYFLMLQMAVIAIFAGAVGAPSGILGVKLFGRASGS